MAFPVPKSGTREAPVAHQLPTQLSPCVCRVLAALTLWSLTKSPVYVLDWQALNRAGGRPCVAAAVFLLLTANVHPRQDESKHFQRRDVFFHTGKRAK